MALSITDQDIIASIQSQLDGLRKTADGAFLYRLIERGLKRRDENFGGDTGQAFVAFLHNILGRYAATPSGDTVTRVKVRLIQQRLAPHMLQTGKESDPSATAPEPIETPVEEIRTTSRRVRPVNEEKPTADPLQAAVDELLAADTAFGAGGQQEPSGNKAEHSPPTKEKTAPTPADAAAAQGSGGTNSESARVRDRRPPEEESVPRADPSRPLFAGLDEIEDTVFTGESIEPDPRPEAAAALPLAEDEAKRSERQGADLTGDDVPADKETRAVGARKPTTDTRAGDGRPAKETKAGPTESGDPAKSSAVLVSLAQRRAPHGAGKTDAAKKAPSARKAPAARNTRAGAKPLATRKSGDVSRTKKMSPPQTRAKPGTRDNSGSKPKTPKPLELEDSWGPAAPTQPAAADAGDGEPDIVVDEPANPWPPRPAPAAPADTMKNPPAPSRVTKTASPSAARGVPRSSVSAPVRGADHGRSDSRLRVDMLHETFANKLAESISRSREYHSVLRSNLDALRLVDNPRNFLDLKKLLVVGLEELLQGSESLGKELGATSHYLRISQLDRDLLKDELTRVRDQSLVDELTGLHNRAGFMRQLEAEIGRTKRYGFSLSVAVLRMESLSEISARHGQEAVNVILRTYAREILSHFRGYDWVSRIGEHRFGILFPNTQKEGAMAALDKAHKRASSMVIRYKATSLKVPPFTSVLTLYSPGDKPEALLQRADEAFALAKEHSRDRIIIALPPH